MASLFPAILLAVHPGLLLAAAATGLLFLLLLWQLFGSGPRRSRAVARAEWLLGQGQWGEALQTARTYQAQEGLSPAWRERLHALEGRCLLAAGDQAVRDRRYEDGLQYYLQAAPLVGGDGAAPLGRVVEVMLAEVRYHFASGPGTNQAIAQLATRVLALQPGAAEAYFWQGLCLVREGQPDRAMALLDNAHQVGGKQHIDPPLYMGILLHRQGRPQEALRLLAEANRVDAGCAFVAWQMGQSMVAAGGDANMAVRVLQKALGPRGLALWLAAPHRAWVEAFPQNRSFVRRLAEKYAYPDPLLGGDLRALVRQGELAVAQAHYRLGNFEESANLFDKLLGESPPTLPLLRGLGLSLTRLGRYDQAYKHLRAAVEMDPQHPLTAAYLALCGARGRPQQPEDKPKNVAWAIRQVARFDPSGDPEFATVLSGIHAEARALDMAVAREDQLRLCDVLASVQATDADAAGAYARLALDHPDAVAPEHGWLFCRAAVQHGIHAEHDRELFALALRDRASAQTYFAQQGWDLEEVEYTFLERSALAARGQFPAELGPDYTPRGEAFLLERSQRQEQKGDLDAALRSATVLLRLSPGCAAAYDRAACLHYRRKDSEKALEVLGAWHDLAPSDPLPLLRRAAIEHQRGDGDASQAAIQEALARARGPARAAVAFLGARLALASTCFGQGAEDAARNGTARSSLPGDVERLLLECLREQPDHADALWTLAALRAVAGDDTGLAELAPRMNRPDVADARFHYLAGVCHLAGHDPARALEAAGRAAAAPGLRAEAQYVAAWAHLGASDQPSAERALQQAAAGNGPSAEHARALLGRLCLQRGGCAEAATWWSALDAGRRAEWGCDEPLRQTVLLAGLLSLQGGQYEEAAERFREAGRLGLRDRRLGPLIGLSLFRAGQRLLFDGERTA